MILVNVRLEVLNFRLLEKFEREAVKIMNKYQGRILLAFETVKEQDGSGVEIHLLEFPSLELFNEYRQDTYLTSLAHLREQAIASTEVAISSSIKSYN